MTIAPQYSLAEVLSYRPRRDTPTRIDAQTASVAPMTPVNPSPPPSEHRVDRRFVIHIDGRDFVAKENKAEMFLRKSGRVVADGNSQLVPLLHEGGVELLSVTPATAVRITEA